MFYDGLILAKDTHNKHQHTGFSFAATVILHSKRMVSAPWTRAAVIFSSRSHAACNQRRRAAGMNPNQFF